MAKFKLERKLYSEDQYISDMIEKAFCDGYELAQRMYAEPFVNERVVPVASSSEMTEMSKGWLDTAKQNAKKEAEYNKLFEGKVDNAVETSRADVKTPAAEQKPQPKKGTKAYYQQQNEELQRQLDAANKSHESKLGDMRKNSETQANKIKELEKQLKEKPKELSSKEKNKILQQGRQKGRRQVGLIGGMKNQWRRSSTLGKAGMVGAGVAGAGALIGTGALIGKSRKNND